MIQVCSYHRDRQGCVDTVMTTDTQELVEEWAATAAAAAAVCLPRPELINIPVINVKQDFSSVQSLSGCGGDCYCWCDCTGVSELLRDSQDYRCRPGTVHSPVHVGNTPVNGEGWGKIAQGFH